MSERINTLTIENSMPRERLDAYLHTQFPSISRGAIQRLMDEGYILVNGLKPKPSQSPRARDIITITWPEPKPATAQPENIALDMLYEDADLLVLNKPAGLVVHPAAGNEEHTLVNALLHHCAGQLSGIGGVARPGIVHRLDKETSGCLVVAKNDVTHLALADQFEKRTIQKVYLAILCGIPNSSRADIKAAIGRHPTQRKRMTVLPENGRESWTSYHVVSQMNNSCLVEATLHTGRTHQIRVHFLHIGHPLVGDKTYGSRANNRLKETTGYSAPRVMLHSWKITFQHPTNQQTLSFTAPIPEDFLEAQNTLRLK